MAAAAVFLPVLKNGFTNYDDPSYVFANPRIQDLSWRGLSNVFSPGADSIYIPLTFLSYTVQFHLFGARPFGYHAASLLFHLLSVALVFALARKLAASDKAAIIAALLFAVHPLHVEPVAWVASQKDLLAGLFFFASLLSYRQFNETRNGGAYGVSLAAFAAAVLSKPVTIMMPFALFLLDRVRPEPVKKTRFIDKIPFFAVAALLAAVTLQTRRQYMQAHPVDNLLTAADRIAGSGNALFFYAAKALAPLRLSCAYPIYQVKNSGPIPALFFGGVFVLAAAALLLLSRKRSAEAFGGAFFILTLIPVLPLVPFGGYNAADRYAYIPLFGLFLSAGVLAVRKKGAVLVLAAAILGLSALTWQRIPVWKDSLALWDNVLEKYPTLTIALKGRAEHYYTNGLTDKAIADLKTILAHHPARAAGIYSMLGDAYLRGGEYGQALEWFDKAVAANPGDAYSLAKRDQIAQLAQH